MRAVDQIDADAFVAARGMWNAALLADQRLALESCTSARRLMQDDVQLALLVRLPWYDVAASDEREPSILPLRARCKTCRHTHGIVRRLRGQDVVRCSGCETYQYCAPRSEMSR